MRNIQKPILTDSGKVECRRCGWVLGEMDAGVFVAGGAVRIWNDVRYSCVGCNRTYYYAEQLITEDGESEHSATQGVSAELKESVLEVVNSLGKDYTPEYEERKRKAS